VEAVERKIGTPVKLNTDTGIAAQWEPNLSVSPSGTVFAVWYDERTGGTCTAGVNTPCYQMFARKSTDNGVTWLPDMAFSDVVSPLPAQPDPGINELNGSLKGRIDAESKKIDLAIDETDVKALDGLSLDRERQSSHT